jgi:hypothetical protein
VKAFLKRCLAAAGYAAIDARKHYARDGLLTIHNDSFRRDPEFLAAYARGVQASNGIDPQFEWRLHILLWAASSALRIQGDFVECGVNAGFLSSAIMHHLRWRDVPKRFYLVDTFGGPVLGQFSAEEVTRGRRDIAEKAAAAGAYVTNLDAVRANFSEWPNAVVAQGEVPGVLPSLPIDTVAFLHIDMNCAMPEVAALRHFWPRLSPGALVLLDDYAYFGHECQARAIDELARELGVEILALPTGQGLLLAR